ncbi:hypothetical protein BS50DRAFT_569753 [Corynespora cassiicola Philippines]|uniref:Uncharacterized protein n=1 Tax=Corynespora cassiicola Philippines TaxID=1448308 RepID=A0A2T2P3G3_CORCC|nr:hypothetical protein BS50DRAFT_569753 [Corynespora cassiicola Philippines]
MSRPTSMPDFSALLDASHSVTESFSTGTHSTESYSIKEQSRKKPSISLAAGLIMGNGSPKSQPNTPRPVHPQPNDDAPTENLFYAYAQKVLASDYAQSPPYILTFASASVCDHWWSLVKREYPDSLRMGPQLFILKGDDMQEQIQDNPKFFELRDKWFYTPGDGASAGVIPIQDYKGNPVSALGSPPPIREKAKDSDFDMSKLSAELGRMNDMISENSAHIRALSVAQSQGLQRMQEINEANTTQIKALADGQAKLQSMMDQNATHYIALSNAAFQNQEQVKSVLKSNADQIKSLAEGQSQLSKSCENMMRTIENLGHTVSTNLTSSGGPPPLNGNSNCVSPGPRKLNRRVKGVWYEYDMSSTPSSSPKRSVSFLDTPPKSPLSTKDTK